MTATPASQTTPYIIIEGIDGSGKDSQAALLCTRLRMEGYDPLLVAEPWDTQPIGALLRQCLKTGAFRSSHAALFLADRFALQEALILPALEAGRPVVSVRSFFSTLVYQQETWGLDWLYKLHDQMLAKPTTAIILDIDPEVSLARVGKRGGTVEVYERLDILQRNRQRYRDLLEDARMKNVMAPNYTLRMLNADDLPEAVANGIWSTVKPRL